MDKVSFAKFTALVISVFVFGIALLDVQDWSAVGVYKGCPLLSRLLYSFFHANLLHAALNAWCLLSVVFIYSISVWRVLSAFIIAVAVPACCLSVTPTVGMSGIVFVLFGSISFEVLRKSYYQLWMLAYIVLGFIFPNTNAWVHLYCYLAGLIIAFLNKPVKLA